MKEKVTIVCQGCVSDHAHSSQLLKYGGGRWGEHVNRINCRWLVVNSELKDIISDAGREVGGRR